MAATYVCLGCHRRYGGYRNACPACGGSVYEEKPAQQAMPAKKGMQFVLYSCSVVPYGWSSDAPAVGKQRRNREVPLL